MESVHGVPTEQSRLAGIVRDVRLRWRLKRLLHGATITLVVGFVVLAVAAWVMDATRYAPVPAMVTRIVALAAVIALVVRYLILPLRRNPDDAQVALYLEEHDPALDGALMTAVDVSGGPNRGSALSPALAARLLRSALERVRALDDGRRVDAADLTRTGAIFAAVLATAVITLLVGPMALRYGMGVSLAPWRAASPAALFTIDVTPGNATVAKGGDQLVTARLHGFQSDHVALVVRSADSSSWTRLLMAPDSTGAYAFRLFDVGTPMDYVVEASGVRSSTYHLDVANLPYVQQVDLQYRYPAYTHLAPQTVNGTGDIAAPPGTMVRIRVTPTVPAAGGRVLVDGGDTLRLVPTADSSLIAMLRVTRSGFYRVELQAPNNHMTTASLDYNIDVIPDRPPTVSFTKPGRDERVLSVDEVYTQAKAEDDYGVAKLDLVYSINGGPDRTVPLSHATARALREVSAGYTFMLEDDSLQPGDVISYYARATDNDAVNGPQSATSDIYFLNVRPYEQEYRQSQSGGGGGRGGQGQSSGRLSDQEREIISGTFNLSRDSATYAPTDLQQNLATLRLAQQKLREQTTQLSQRLVQRGITASDTGFRKISELLRQATPQMDTAEQRLASGSPHSALPSEQRALTQLQRAEAVFHDIQVSQGNGGGGGGGGGGANAQDLADIFELNKDKLRNQYETVQRGQTQQQQQQQQANQKVDELMEKLKQLAARQQQQDQRAQRKADSLSRMGAAGSSSGSGQRQLADQTEQTARQLERLARQQQSQSLADAARRLQNAADAMRRAAADRGQQGAANSQQALQQLDAARRLVDRERSQRAGRQIQDAMRTQQGLANRQQQVTGDINRLEHTNASQQQALRRQIADEQRAMADSVKALTSRLDRMALDNRRDQPAASRAIAAAADSLRKRGTADRLGYMSQNATRTAPPQYLGQQQQPIGRDIADLGKQLQQASTAAGQQSAQQQQAEALDRMRDLVQGLQSVRERLRQQEQSGQQTAQAGRQGQTGRQGSPGQQQPVGRAQQGNQGQQGAAAGRQQGAGGQQSGQGARQGASGAQQGQRGQGAVAGGNGGRGSVAGRLGGGGGTAGGVPRQPGAGTPRGLTPGEAQQFSRELRQRVIDADSLRGLLQRQGIDVAELNRAIARLQNMTRPGVLAGPNAASALQSQVIEGLAAFEFALRRTLGNDDQRVLAGRSGDVPPSFRALVEEYYRAIARSKKPNGGKR